MSGASLPPSGAPEQLPPSLPRRPGEPLSPGSVPPPWRMAGLPPRTPVLLALSGGPDSRALLHLLAAQAARDGFPLLLAHVHHGIRGAEADRDADFCRALAARYGLELLLLRADVPGLAARTRRGLEETARQVRYDFFGRVMRERAIPLLATAHQADDQLETMLFRLCRGSGLGGLCGIPPVRPLAGGYVTRPLLEYSRREILAFCTAQGLDFVSDSTNPDLSYARNRIRQRAVPELEAAVPDPQGGACRLSRALSQDRDYLDRAAGELLAAHLRQGCFPAGVLRQAHPALRRRVLAALCPRAPGAAHIEAMEALVLSGRSGSACPLPGGWQACLQQQTLWVLPVLRRPPLPRPVPLRAGSFALCDGLLTVCVKKAENFPGSGKVHNLATERYIIIDEGSDIMLGQGCWRCRQEGDAMVRHGVRRRVRRLLREAGIPPALRDALPLLCDREGVLWVPFVGARDGYAPALSGTPYRAELVLTPGHRPERPESEDCGDA